MIHVHLSQVINDITCNRLVSDLLHSVSNDHYLAAETGLCSMFVLLKLMITFKTSVITSYSVKILI